MEQVAKLKRTWNLVPVLQNVQKIPKIYSPCLYIYIISVCQIWWLYRLWFKRCIQNAPCLMYSLTKVEYIYFKYTSNTLEVYFQSIFEVHFKYTWTILQVYFKYQLYIKYTSSILQPVELKKKNYTSSLYCFNKRGKFEADLCEMKSGF